MGQLKRQHSAEPLNANSRKSPASAAPSHGATPPAETDTTISSLPTQTLPNNVFGDLPDESIIGSPLKKHRASLYDLNSEGLHLGANFTSPAGDIVVAAEAAQTPLPPAPKIEMEEEL